MLRIKEETDLSVTHFQSTAVLRLKKLISEKFDKWDEHGDKITEAIVEKVNAYGREIIALEDLKLGFPLDFKCYVAGEVASQNILGQFPGNFYYFADFSHGDLKFLSICIRFWYNPYSRDGLIWGVDPIKVDRFVKSKV